MGRPRTAPDRTQRHPRNKPLTAYTLTPEVNAAVRARAAALGAKLSHIADAALRVGLGLPPAPGKAAA